MELLARCLACRARLGEADVCPRCGTDFTLSRRAQRQAATLAQAAVYALARGHDRQSAAAAAAACHLANPLLAQAVAHALRRREEQRGALDPDCLTDESHPPPLVV